MPEEGGSYIDNAVLKAITWVVKGITSEWGKALWEWFSKLFLAPTAVINDPDVLKINLLLVAVAISVMPVMIVGAVLRYKLDLMAGENTTPPETLVKRCLLAGMAIMGTPTIAWAGGYMADSMVEAIGKLSVDLNLLETFFVIPGSPGLGILLLGLIFLVGGAILMVQRFFMVGEFTLLMAAGPIMGISLLRNEHQGAFQTWLREVGSILLTPVLQLLITWFFVRTFAKAGPLNSADFFKSFAYLFLLYRMPRWARTWMYSAGGGDAMVAGAHAVARHVVMMQMFKRLGKGG
jgi:hypothetical protein